MEEAQLLHKINQGIDPELRAQYQTLRAKKEAETLTDDEYNTLIQRAQYYRTIRRPATRSPRQPRKGFVKSPYQSLWKPKCFNLYYIIEKDALK